MEWWRGWVWGCGEKAATLTGGGGGGSSGGGPADRGMAYSGSAGGESCGGGDGAVRWRWVSCRCGTGGGGAGFGVRWAAGPTKCCVPPDGVSAAQRARGSGYSTSPPTNLDDLPPTPSREDGSRDSTHLVVRPLRRETRRRHNLRASDKDKNNTQNLRLKFKYQ